MNAPGGGWGGPLCPTDLQEGAQHLGTLLDIRRLEQPLLLDLGDRQPERDRVNELDGIEGRHPLGERTDSGRAGPRRLVEDRIVEHRSKPLEPVPDVGRQILEPGVPQKLHVSEPKAPGLGILREDPEPASTGELELKAAGRQAHGAHDPTGTPDREDAGARGPSILARSDQHHPDDAVAFESRLRQRPVARLEDVKAQLHVGKEHAVR